MPELSTMDKVRRLVHAATGEEWGDGYTVTDVILGYAEPGYGSDDSVVVLGDWNPKRWASEGDAPLTPAERLPSRLARSLERVGANIEWLDEWTSCSECLRAVRTQPDSYSWQASFVVTEDGDTFCLDCLIAQGEDALTEYVNDARKCVSWCEPSHVESFGYVKWESGDPHDYESGWHPGQDDDPSAILASIHAAQPGADVVFFLDESSQFYVRFSAYVRQPRDDD